MRRKEVLIAVIGGIVGAVLVMVAGLFSPLGAQSAGRDVNFGDIVCESIVVRNADGEDVVLMGSDENGGGSVVASGKGGESVIMGAHEQGARVMVRDERKRRSDYASQ